MYQRTVVVFLQVYVKVFSLSIAINDLPCLMVSLAAPPPGCRYEIKTDKRGCYLSHETICDHPCPYPLPPMAAPPENCRYHIEYDDQGCYKSHQLVCEKICPHFLPPIVEPPEHCHYDIEYDAEGCYLKHHLICEPSNPVCKLPKEIGPCDAVVTRYYYNTEENRCTCFDFGGCEGNENNFGTREECEKTCQYQTTTTEPPTKPPQTEDQCFLPLDPGPCKGSFPRYYYEPEEKKCVKFTYGGCMGNSNNFLSDKECLGLCAPCHQPKKVGPCEALIPSWYYDSSCGKCKSFNYGGCQGNDNRFDSEEECRKQCAASVFPSETAYE